jgi:hypothetical protein
VYYITCKLFRKLYSDLGNVTDMRDRISEHDVGRTCSMGEITGGNCSVKISEAKKAVV